MRILMVCLGNICRSSMAEGVLRHMLEQAGIAREHEVDSCGFESCHLGQQPHRMAIATAQKHGTDISHQRQRLFCSEDFVRFDKIYVMDHGNYADVQRMATRKEDMLKVDYLYNEVAPGNIPIPDPWGGTYDDFEHSYNMIEQACAQVVRKLQHE